MHSNICHHLSSPFQTWRDTYTRCAAKLIEFWHSHTQCDVVITRSISSQIHTIDTPQLAHEGEMWDAFCEPKVWFQFRHWHHSAVCNCDKVTCIRTALEKHNLHYFTNSFFLSATKRKKVFKTGTSSKVYWSEAGENFNKWARINDVGIGKILADRAEFVPVASMDK